MDSQLQAYVDLRNFEETWQVIPFIERKLYCSDLRLIYIEITIMISDYINTDFGILKF
jgi:hypothetical protein